MTSLTYRNPSSRAALFSLFRSPRSAAHASAHALNDEVEIGQLQARVHTDESAQVRGGRGQLSIGKSVSFDEGLTNRELVCGKSATGRETKARGKNERANWAHLGDRQ